MDLFAFFLLYKPVQQGQGRVCRHFDIAGAVEPEKCFYRFNPFSIAYGDPNGAHGLFGHAIQLQIPGGPEVMLYEPRYDPPALTL